MEDLVIGQEVMCSLIDRDGKIYLRFIGTVKSIYSETVVINDGLFDRATGKATDNLPIMFEVVSPEIIREYKEMEYKPFHEAVANEQRYKDKFGHEAIDLKTGGRIIFADVPVYHSPEKIEQMEIMSIIDNTKTICFVNKLTHKVSYLNYEIRNDGQLYEYRLLSDTPCKQALAREDVLKLIDYKNKQHDEYNRYYICLTGY